MKFKVGDIIQFTDWHQLYEILEIAGHYARLKNIESGWEDSYFDTNINDNSIVILPKNTLEVFKKDIICAKIAMMDKRWKDRNKSLKKKPNKILFTQSI